MDGIGDLTKLIPLEAGLYGLAIAFAILLRLGRAALKWFNGGHTLVVGILVGLFGATLKLAAHHSWTEVIEQGFFMSVVVLIGERVLRAGGGKIPGLPKDNEWVKQGENDEASASDSGST